MAWQEKTTMRGGGRRVISVKNLRENIIEKAQREDVIKEHLLKAFSILIALEQKGVEKADIIGHSEGSLAAIVAAKECPEKFRNLILVNPAGILGNDSFGSLAIKFIFKEGWNNIKTAINNPTGMAKYLKEAASYISSNLDMSLNEINGIAKTNLVEVLGELRGQGIKISIIAGENDTVFPADELESKLADYPIDNYEVINGGHGKLIFDKNMVPVLENTLKRLEK